MNKKESIKHFEDMPYVSVSQMGKKSFIDLIEQLDEPQKVTVPKFVAEYIEFKKKYDFHVYGAMREIEDHYDKRVPEWFYENNIEIFVRAWLDGYEVEKEKRYLVKIKGIDSKSCYLKRVGNKWIISESAEHRYMYIYTAHTRKELEKAGFGEVFDSPLFEVEEVEE